MNNILLLRNTETDDVLIFTAPSVADLLVIYQ
jgi:hypothetical protein